MALPGYALPYGIRDLKLRSISAADVVSSTEVDIPAARTLSFAEAEDFDELRGDDIAFASHGNGPVVNWDLEGGGLSVDAYVIIAGGTVTTSGTTPNAKKTYSKLGTDARPYFQVEGQVISDNGGDVHALIYKCKATGDLGGDFQEGSFFLFGASGVGYPESAGGTGKLYDFVHNETAAAIT
jgi:hypothetical protein